MTDPYDVTPAQVRVLKTLLDGPELTGKVHPATIGALKKKGLVQCGRTISSQWGRRRRRFELTDEGRKVAKWWTETTG